jgi:2-polyprenyl-3-methyl-5-hydroxy-6-metoxy-1,4-benzoquinol methylase
MDCTICKSAEVKVKFNITEDHKVFCCSSCGIEFLDPQLNDAELKKLYSENYYRAWGIQGEQENEITKEMKIATFQLRLNLIRQFITKGRVLDVGCATGYFLEIAEKNGFLPFGVEFSEYSSAIAKKKFGDKNIFFGTLEQCDFENKSFDVIAMSDLIEHVRIPAQTLSKASALLKDGGIIMIMTPDTNTLSNKLMGKRWTHYKLEHFFYFNRSSINYAAETCGLDVVHYERSKKALNIKYLHTQFNVYKHWLLTPVINIIHALVSKKVAAKNFYFSIGEMVVILKKRTTNVS